VENIELLDAIRAYYKRYPMGGSLHIVLDDGNTEAWHVQFARDIAISNKDNEGVRLADRLLELDDNQRISIYAALWKMRDAE